MTTCISANCPYIFACKDYNFKVDRSGGCGTRSRLTEAAKGEQRKTGKKGSSVKGSEARE